MSSNQGLLSTRKYAVGLSYARPREAYVKQVAELLAETLGKDRVFFDLFHPEVVNGLDRDVILPQIFSTECEVVVVFVCSEYLERDWTILEFGGIRDLRFTQQGERVVLATFDFGVVLPGQRKGDIPFDATTNLPTFFADLAIKRLQELKGEVSRIESGKLSSEAEQATVVRHQSTPEDQLISVSPQAILLKRMQSDQIEFESQFANTSGLQLEEDLRKANRIQDGETAQRCVIGLQQWLRADGAHAAEATRCRVFIVLSEYAFWQAAELDDERPDVGEVRRFIEQAKQELSPTSTDEDAARILSMESKFDWLEGRRDKALTELAVCNHPICVSNHVTMLMEAGAAS